MFFSVSWIGIIDSPQVYIYTWPWLCFEGNPGPNCLSKEAMARCWCILLDCLFQRGEMEGGPCHKAVHLLEDDDLEHVSFLSN